MKFKDRKPDRFNASSERMKVKYRIHVRRVGKKDEKTILAVLRHIRDFELFIDFKGFEAFNANIADKYIQGMFDADISLSYINDNIRSLREFLTWLERQRGYRTKINYNHIDYLNLSRNQQRTAKSSEYQKAYKYDDIIKTIRLMPDKTDKDKRNKAIVSLQATCTLRIGELRTVKLKNLIEEDGIYFIHVCPKSMKVKFSKTRQAVFVPLPDDIKENVLNWHNHLVSVGFKDRDPLFPKIDNRFGVGNLLKQTTTKAEIKSDTTIRNIFKSSFENAGFEYIKPHSFRHTLSRYAQTQSPQFFNAVRQNLGQKSIDITLNSYGQLSHYDQRRVISESNFSE